MGHNTLKNHPPAMESKFGRQRDDISLPCIVIPKESGHCKCNECHALKKFKRGAKTELQMSVADKLMQEHLDVCARERIQVWELFQKCADFKQEHIGIQFDDMDQTKELKAIHLFFSLSMVRRHEREF